MDKYFYTLDENGLIHILGNVYKNDDERYISAEWTFLYLEISDAKEMLQNDELFNYIFGKIAYIEDVTKEEAEEMCNCYFNGNSGTELHILDITEDTPCGEYWFE